MLLSCCVLQTFFATCWRHLLHPMPVLPFMLGGRPRSANCGRQWPANSLPLHQSEIVGTALQTHKVELARRVESGKVPHFGYTEVAQRRVGGRGRSS